MNWLKLMNNPAWRDVDLNAGWHQVINFPARLVLVVSPKGKLVNFTYEAY